MNKRLSQLLLEGELVSIQLNSLLIVENIGRSRYEGQTIVTSIFKVHHKMTEHLFAESFELSTDLNSRKVQLEAYRELWNKINIYGQKIMIGVNVIYSSEAIAFSSGEYPLKRQLSELDAIAVMTSKYADICGTIIEKDYIKARMPNED